MNFIRGKSREFYLLTSEIENIFLNEYMPSAPGDYVKVYLFGLMYAQHHEEMDHQTLAKQLRLSEETVDQAWSYWADMQVIKKHSRGGHGILSYDVEFVNLRDQMYASSPREEEPESFGEMDQMIQNRDLKTLIGDIEKVSGKVLSSRDTQEIYSWIQDFGAKPALIRYAFEYCCRKGKTNIKYISKVVAQWSSQGFQTEEDARQYLEQVEARYGEQKRILHALGLNRSATEAEKKMIDQWLDEMHFSMERVLEACGRTISISNPNLRYVNKILENWYQEARIEGRDVNKKVTVTQTVLNKYYEYLRKKEEKEAQERKEEVYGQIPRIAEIDRQLTELGSTISRNLLSGRDQGLLAISRRQMEELEGERAVLLTEHNFTMDYTDIRYSCDLCKDTGVTEEGQRCACTKKRMEEAELWQKSI